MSDTDALEIQMILGNLYRAKGQVGRAITLHQSLLQRPDLTRLEHAYVQLCLALDFRTAASSTGRSRRSRRSCGSIPKRYALVRTAKLHEEAAAVDRRRCASARDCEARRRPAPRGPARFSRS